ncbi:MAG: lysophospholipid acyltransferase family protein [Rickettsiales bacterium]
MIRSLLFNFFYITWTLLVGILFIPIIFFPTHIIILVVGKIWARGLYFFLKYCCNLSLDLRGIENIPKTPAIFASKHQSALETFMFHLLVHKPVFVLKKELLDLPVFGFYLRKMGMIAIDRDGGIKSLKLLLRSVDEKIKQGYSIIIFPEGTRTSPGESVNYNAGITAIYNLKMAVIVPVALNTGCYWPKDSFLKKPGKFVIEFLPAMSNILDKKEFLNQLQSVVEDKSRELLP